MSEVNNKSSLRLQFIKVFIKNLKVGILGRTFSYIRFWIGFEPLEHVWDFMFGLQATNFVLIKAKFAHLHLKPKCQTRSYIKNQQQKFPNAFNP
jgi:hypothetical protein